MSTTKRIINKFIPTMLIVLLVLSSIVTNSTNTIVSAASSDNTKHNSGYLNRSSVELHALKNTNTISLNTRSMKLIKGTSAHLKVLNASSLYQVSFQSTNTKIATVTSSGQITGRKNGTTTIIATIKYNNRSIRKLTCSVEVGPAAVSIVIPKSKLSIKLGKSQKLKYIIKTSNSVETPTFKTSNKKVATITKSGMIKTHSKGTAVITAQISNGKSDKITIAVTK